MIDKTVFTLGELFCGPGGLAYGALHASIEGHPEYKIVHKWANDIDPDTCDTYRKNICSDDPESVICGNIKTLDLVSIPQWKKRRHYLSARGKVNKGILSTIKNYPEMFFAYNNGIAATAAELDTKMTSNGMIITRIKDLQIVNGGQTTASLASAVLTAKKDEKVDVSAVFVPMKVSVLEHSMSELIIPKISEYSNSQNKVDASDFFSNHPFHIRMEGLSRKIHTPAVHGNQYQQYWYYERTRGQYNQGKMKFKPKSAQMKAYEDRYPEKQVIKMVDLARYMELYFGAPDIVSKGKQEIVKHFAEQIKKEWAKSDADFNQFYYKRVVALAIIFHETDDIIKETKWYKEKKSYKANVIAYTISILFDYIKNNYPDKDVDFLRIWDAQELYPEMRMQLSALCTEVYEFITREDRSKNESGLLDSKDPAECGA